MSCVPTTGTCRIKIHNTENKTSAIAGGMNFYYQLDLNGLEQYSRLTIPSVLY